jgi:hypothetical protein
VKAKPSPSIGFRAQRKVMKASSTTRGERYSEFQTSPEDAQQEERLPKHGAVKQLHEATVRANTSATGFAGSLPTV